MVYAKQTLKLKKTQNQSYINTSKVIQMFQMEKTRTLQRLFLAIHDVMLVDFSYTDTGGLIYDTG